MAEQNGKSLRARLAEAESIIEALRTGSVDAVVDEQQVLLLRLREVEDELRRSEARYRAVVEDQAELIYRWDANGRLTFVNQAFCRFLDRPREELKGSSLEQALPADMKYTQLWGELAAPGAEGAWLEREQHVARPTGETCWLNVTHRLIVDDAGAPTEIQSVARDVTDRREAQEALHAANAELEQRVQTRTAQLRALVRELDQAEQRERRRLAEFLHDDLQQLLVASKFGLEALSRSTLDDTRQKALARTQDLIDRSIAASRSLVSQLSPPALHNNGLIAALHWLGDQMQELHHLSVRVDADPRAEPETDHVRDLLFAFARELLLNVIKHAEASQAWVGLRQAGDEIELEVRDDGVGFDPAARDFADAETHFGLWSIAERSRLLGGAMHIDSAPGRGCRVVLTAPVTAVADDDCATPPKRA